jgi:hypothetical protein
MLLYIADYNQVYAVSSQFHNDGMVEHFIRKIHPHFTYGETWFCANSKPPELEVVIDTASMALFAIKSLHSYCTKVCSKGFNEVTLRRQTCGLDGTSPKPMQNPLEFRRF